MEEPPFVFSKYAKYFVIAAIIILIYVSYLLIKPFLTPLLGAIIVAIAATPLYNRIKSKVKRGNISALIVILLIIILIVIPLIMFTNRLFTETASLFNSVSDLDLNPFTEKLQQLTGLDIDFGRQIKDGLQAVSKYLLFSTADLIQQIARGMLHLFIFFFTLFFLLKDGKRYLRKLMNFLPIREDLEKKLFIEINKVVKSLITGVLVIAVIEGIIALIGFYLFGIPTPLIWSFVIVLAAYLPIIGPATVYVPAAIYLAILGNITEAVLLFIYSFALISYLDNIVKPQFMGKGSNINPIIILLGTLGGISLFGLTGIIAGPLILSILLVLYRIYEQENATKDKKY